MKDPKSFYRIDRPTQAVMYAVGRDAANRAMRKAGRKKWSRADYNVACAEFSRLIPLLGTPA